MGLLAVIGPSIKEKTFSEELFFWRYLFKISFSCHQVNISFQ